MASLATNHFQTVWVLYSGLREQNPHLDELPVEPTNFRWRYLSADSYDVLALTEWAEDGSVTISIHPLAFTPSWEFVLLGLLNHELSHLICGSREAHGPIFRQTEKGWTGFEQWIGERREFAKFVQAEVKSNLDSLRHRYTCPMCNRIIECKHRLQVGAACYACCALNNSGRWLKGASLKYEGLLPQGVGLNNEPTEEQA